MNKQNTLGEFDRAMKNALEKAETRNESISQAFKVLNDNPEWAKVNFIHQSYKFKYSLKLWNGEWFVSE